MHQFVQRPASFVLQQRRRQIEADPFVEKLHDLLFFRALDFVFLFVLEVVLNRVAQLRQRLLRHDLRRERIVDRRQDLFLDLIQRYRVVRFLSSQLGHWKL